MNSWREFMKKIPEQLAGKCSEGVQALVVAIIEGNLENYMVGDSSRKPIISRLFVSRIMTYYSEKAIDTLEG